jgi:hypothetical protein
MSEGDRCGTCRYYDARTDGPGMGTCRVNPPAASSITQGYYQPPVSPCDWCGRYKVIAPSAREMGRGFLEHAFWMSLIIVPVLGLARLLAYLGIL